jgi:hypothetical protein
MLMSVDENSVTGNCVGRVISVGLLNRGLLRRHVQLPQHHYTQDLLVAANEGNDAEITRLLAFGVDVNSAGPAGDVALQRIADVYGDNFGRWLVLQRISSEQRMRFSSDDRERYCHLWTQHRVRLLNRLLVERGARPDGLEGTSWTPLLTALSGARRANCDNTLIVEELLRPRRADPNRLYVSPYDVQDRPIFIAISDGLPSYVEALLRAGADPKLRDVNGLTPLLRIVTADPDASCWDGDNGLAAMYRKLLPVSDLTATIPANGRNNAMRYAGMTARQVLRTRLQGHGCRSPTCNEPMNGPGRCLRRMWQEPLPLP